LAACHEFEDGQSARPSEHLVRKLSRQFPDSIIVVTESFPRWETWNSLLDSGADLIVAKPFQLTGIYDTLSTLCRTYSPTTPPNRPE